MSEAAESQTAALASASDGSRGESSTAYRILHISDIHFGSTFDYSLWEYIEALAADKRPNLVACTGDIVDHGGLFMLALARRQLEDLCGKCRPKEGRVPLEVAPGNHDVGLWGNIAVWPWRTNFNTLFGVESVELPATFPTYVAYRSRWLPRRLWWRLRYTTWLYLAKGRRWVKLFGSTQKRPLMDRPAPDHYVLIVRVDSNHGSWLATGQVDPKEVTRLKALVLAQRTQVPHDVFLPRICLVHHHPLPIPHSKITEGLTSFEPFLVLRNAGLLLRELNRCDVDLILHGHKHYSSFSRLGYTIDHESEGEIAVLAAGSAGVTIGEAGRNSVNVVDLLSNGRMSYTTVAFGGGAGKQVTKLFEDTEYVHSLAMHKRRVFRRAVERQGIWATAHAREVLIDDFGSAFVTERTQEIHVESDREIDYWPVYLSTSLGRINPTTLRFCDVSLREGHAWKERYSQAVQRLEGKIDLRQPLTPAASPFSYEIAYIVFNGFAMTQWESVQAYERDRDANVDQGRRLGLESAGVVVRFPMKRLELKVRLPSTLVNPRPYLRVSRHVNFPRVMTDGVGQLSERDDDRWIADPVLTKEEASLLHPGSDGIWCLSVDYPMVGHRYDIVWRVQDERELSAGDEYDDADEIESRMTRGRTLAWRALLHSDRSAEQVRRVIPRWMKFARRRLLKHLRAGRSPNETFSVSLFVYDENERSLRLVHEERATSDAPPDLAIPLSEGVVGAAFKRRAAVSYQTPDLASVDHQGAYLYHPEGSNSGEAWKVVWAFPLIDYPDGDQLSSDTIRLDADRKLSEGLIGVVTVASDAPDTPLVALRSGAYYDEFEEENDDGDGSMPEAGEELGAPGAADAQSTEGEDTHESDRSHSSDVGEPLTIEEVWAFVNIVVLVALQEVAEPPPGDSRKSGHGGTVSNA